MIYLSLYLYLSIYMPQNKSQLKRINNLYSLDMAESKKKSMWSWCLDFILQLMEGSDGLGAGGVGPKAKSQEEKSPWCPD